MKVMCIIWRQEWLGGESRIHEEGLWWEKTSEFVWERRLEGEERHSWRGVWNGKPIKEAGSRNCQGEKRGNGWGMVLHKDMRKQRKGDQNECTMAWWWGRNRMSLDRKGLRKRKHGMKRKTVLNTMVCHCHDKPCIHESLVSKYLWRPPVKSPSTVQRWGSVIQQAPGYSIKKWKNLGSSFDSVRHRRTWKYQQNYDHFIHLIHLVLFKGQHLPSVTLQQCQIILIPTV